MQGVPDWVLGVGKGFSGDRQKTSFFGVAERGIAAFLGEDLRWGVGRVRKLHTSISEGRNGGRREGGRTIPREWRYRRGVTEGSFK